MSVISLNPAQSKAVEHQEGPLLLLAGAGTGKTHTLCARVSQLISSGTPAHEILLLTFTRKAAHEMSTRIGDLLFDASQNIHSGTFHAIAFMDLRACGKLNSLLGMLDESAASSYLRKQLKQVKFAPLQSLSPRNILQLFSLCNNTRQSTSKVLSQFFPEVATHLQLINDLREIYQKYKDDMKVMDYDDILLLWLQALEEGASTPSINCRYILVDEYQDTSQLQVDILKALCRNHRNIMAVGDDCQSIYSFRGALPAQLKNFPLDFPGAQTIALEDNYRSTNNILTHSNQLMESARDVLPKKLISATQSQGTEPEHIYSQSKFQTPKIILDKILKLRSQGTPLAEQAILYRSSVHALMLEAHLVREGTPYIKYGSRKLTEAAHLKDFLALLIFVFHDTLHPMAVQRSLEILPGLGAKTLEKILSHLHQGNHLLDFKFPAKSEFAVKQLLDLRQNNSSITKASIDEVFQFYSPFLNQRFDDAFKRQRDIHALTQNLLEAPSLDDFFTDIALSYGEQAQEPEGDALVLSTIHSAKGKEWDAVYILDVNEGSIPLSSASDIEEERRLLYVAMTRARKKLHLLINSFPGAPQASRFIGNKSAHTRNKPSFKNFNEKQFSSFRQIQAPSNAPHEPQIDSPENPHTEAEFDSSENDDPYSEPEAEYTPYTTKKSPTTSIATSDDDELTYVSLDDW